MYRNRIHFTVRDMDGWNTMMEVHEAIKEIATRLGQPTATMWTETVGVFNQLTFELDYESLAQFETSEKAMRADPEWGKQVSRLQDAAVDGKGWTELMETVEKG